MARIWKLSGSPLLLIILLSAPFLALLATGQINGFKIFGGSVISGFQSAAFDSTSNINSVSAFNCNNSLGSGWFGYGESPPSNYPCKQSGPTSTIVMATSTSPAITLPIATIGSDSNDAAFLRLPGNNCVPGGLFTGPACAHASLLLGGGTSTGFLGSIFPGAIGCATALTPQPITQSCINGPGNPSCPATQGNCNPAPSPSPNPTPPIITSTVGSTSTYALSGTISFPYNKIGSDQNFQSTFNEPVPSCNPCITGNSTYWLEYGFAFRLQITGDSIIANISCNTLSALPVNCASAEAAAANQALSFINANDAATGTVTIDLTIPLSLANNPKDKFGLIGAWIAQKGFYTSSLTNGGTVAVTPGSNHAIVPINNLPFSQFNYQSLNGWSPGQIPSVLPTSISMPFTYNIQPKYTAVTNGQNIAILADYGITVDVPIVFVLVDQSTSPPPSGGGCGGLPTCPTYGNTTSNILVHVTESVLGLPLSGVQVAAVSAQATACSASGGSTGTTDNNGNYLFQGLSSANGGNYLVCATGTSGTLTLIFVSFQLTYGCNGGSCTTQATISSGKSASVTLPLQTSFNSQLTTISIVLIGVGILLFLVVVIVAPRSLLALGFGSARAIRASGRRR